MPPQEGMDQFQLPKALVTRIAKSALLAEAKLQKDTMHALVESATVFINYLAATAHDVALSRSKKTIAAGDVLKAMEIVELGDLVSLLESELEVYRAGSKPSKDRQDKKGKGKEKETTAAEGPPSDDGEEEPEEEQEQPKEEDHMEDEEEQEEDEEEDEEEPEPLVDTTVVEEKDLRNNNKGLEEEQKEGEPLVDTTAVEEKELQKDNKGLDDDAMSEDG